MSLELFFAGFAYDSDRSPPVHENVEGSVRRLAAVWFADIVGYTRLSGIDENTALDLVNVLQEVSRVEVAAHGGRVVKYIGDAVLAEFQSTEAAVRAALALNARYEAASKGVGHASQLRIGVHVGDVLGTADGDLYGDGINTASRVQGAADPGHIWVTEDVWSQLRARRDFRFTSVGDKAFKGLEEKLSIYNVRFGGQAASQGGAAAAPSPAVNRARRYARLVRVGLVYLVSAGVLVVVTGLIRNSLGLAPWVMVGGVLILLAGLLVTLTTEWVQSRPVLEGEPGPRPWLTWSRALAGGVSMYTLLFVAAGLYELITNPGTGPQEVSAQGDSLQPESAQPAPVQQGAASGDPAPPVSEPPPAETAQTEVATVPSTPAGGAAGAARESAPRADAASDAYESARVRMEAARRSAVTAGATRSLVFLARADSARDQGLARANQDRFAEAESAMNRARGLYDDARNAVPLQERVDSILDVLGGLRATRLSGNDATEAQQRRLQATEAEQAGRYPDAIRLLQEVVGIYRSAAEAQARADAAARQAPPADTRPAAQPPEPVAPAPAARASKEEITAEVLESIRLAIEAKDMDALRAVWELTPSQVQGFRAGWPIMDQLRVRITTNSVDEVGDRITARVSMRYDFRNLSDARRELTQESPQILILTQQGSRWTAVSGGP